MTGSTADEIRRAVDAVWRVEGLRIVTAVAALTRDVALAEDVAHEAVLEALGSWTGGIPDNPGAWLTTVAKRRVIDAWRRRERLDERYAALAHDLESTAGDDWELIDDDVLRLLFTACHPVLSRESQVALTLRVVGGLSTEEIARGSGRISPTKRCGSGASSPRCCRTSRSRSPSSPSWSFSVRASPPASRRPATRCCWATRTAAAGIAARSRVR